MQQQLLVPKHRAAEAREVILAAGRDAARGARPVERRHQVDVLRNVPDDHLVQRVHMRLGHFDGTRVDQVDGAPAEAPNVLGPLVRRSQRQHAIGAPMGKGARKLGDPCPLLEAEINLEIERRLVRLDTPLLALDLLQGSVRVKVALALVHGELLSRSPLQHVAVAARNVVVVAQQEVGDWIEQRCLEPLDESDPALANVAMGHAREGVDAPRKHVVAAARLRQPKLFRVHLDALRAVLARHLKDEHARILVDLVHLVTTARLDLGQPLASELLAAHVEACRLGELRERTPLPERLEHLLAKRAHLGVDVVCHAEKPHTFAHAHVRWRRVDAQEGTRAVELECELLRLGALFGAAPRVLVLLVGVAARGALA